MSDDLKELFLEADRMSHRLPSERLSWLDQIREQLRDHPNIAVIIQSLNEYMDSHKKLSETKVRHAQLSEHLEADAFSRLEALLSLSPEEFETRLSTEGIAQIALLSLMLDPLRVRTQSPDAQDKLWAIFFWLLKKHNAE